MELRTIENGCNTAEKTEAVFEQHYDIIIAGGGTAGAIAAVTAAGEGVKTLCIEMGSFLGGIGSGIVTGYYYGKALKGTIHELDTQIKQESQGPYCAMKSWCEGIHMEAKKYVYEKRFHELGGTILYESVVTGIWVDSGRVIGVRTLFGGRVADFGCRMLIDATSEAVACKLAHLGVKSGREFDGQCQAYSLVSFIINKDGELEQVYRDNGFADTGCTEEVAEAVTHGYATADNIGAYSREEGDSPLVALGPFLGKREGVSCVGRDALTGEDLLLMQRVDKPFFYLSGSYDTHLYDGAFESDTVNDFLACGISDVVLNQPVPFGASVPAGLDGILAAGLSMDIRHDALAPARLKKNVMRSGEAAAVAAVTAIKLGKEPLECYEAVRKELIRREIYLEEPMLSEQMLEAKKDLKAAIRSDDKRLCGCGTYLAAREMPREDLLTLTQDKRVRYRAAIALALQGDAGAAGILREYENEPFALYFLGKFNKGEYTPLLLRKMQEVADHSLFCYAFTALVRSAAAGDKMAEQGIWEVIFSDSFSCTLILNGKRNQQVLERRDKVREYARKYLNLSKE